MKNNEKLVTNTLLFAINSFGSRIIVFLLVPLYAHYMSKSSYGTADLVFSTVSLLLTLFTLKVSAAILRFAKENSHDNSLILNNAIRVIIISSFFILAVVLIMVSICSLSSYFYYLPAVYLVSGLKDVFSQYCKAIGKTKVYAIEGAVSSISLLTANIIFIIILGLDIHGYLISILMSNAIAVIYLLLFGGIMLRYDRMPLGNRLMKDMLTYSIPLVPNSFSWWIIQMSDRYMVAWFISKAANGVYTMSYKIPSMMGVVSDIFMQAWVLSAISEYDGEKDFSGFSRVYDSFEGLLFIVSTIVVCLNKPIALLLYGDEFLEASLFAPLLVFALVFNNLQAFFGSLFNAAKKTKELMYSAVFAAVLNIILNYCLIKTIGLYGAIISTCLSYAVLTVFRIIGSQKYIKFNINYIKLTSNCLCLLIIAINEAFIKSNYIKYLLDIAILSAVCVINYHRLKNIYNMIMSMIRRVLTRRVSTDY